MKKETWKEVWTNSEYTGKVVLARRKDQEYLEIHCDEVMQRYGTNAEILDDGRSIHVSVNDVVAFGVVDGQIQGQLIAVNVWRISFPRKATDAGMETKDAPPAKQRKVVKAAPKGIRMLGSVQKPGANGRFSVFCQDISDVYGRDAEIPPEHAPSTLQVGDRISFTVQELEGTMTNSGPIWAKDVQVLGSGSLSKPPALGDGEDLEGADELELKDDGGETDEGEDVALEVLDDAFADELQDAKAKMPNTPEEWQAAQSRFFSGRPKLRPHWIRIRSKSTGKVYFYNMISVDAAEVPEEDEEVAGFQASEAEQKADEEGNDPDAYAAAVQESADAVQGIELTERDRKDEESMARLKEYQDMVKNDPEAALDKYGGNFVEEWVEERSVKDPVFAKFTRFHALNKNHVLRYHLGGAARWFCQFRQLEEVPKCSLCGGPRVFECQVQPMLIAQLKGPLQERLDFGTICIYSCEESCEAVKPPYIEEFAYVQPEPGGSETWRYHGGEGGTARRDRIGPLVTSLPKVSLQEPCVDMKVPTFRTWPLVGRHVRGMSQAGTFCRRSKRWRDLREAKPRLAPGASGDFFVDDIVPEN
eukprot:symbB.v1.2.031333.t1/scaffold3624.1/size53936/3